MGCLVCNGSDDAADHGRSEDGPAVRLMVMFDVDGLAVGRRRGRVGTVVACGLGVVRDMRFAVVRGLGSVLLRLRGRGLLVLPGGSGRLAAARCGSRQCRGAKGRSSESDGRDLDYVLVHVTPFQPFRASCPYIKQGSRFGKT